jgi:Thioredoxin-like domain/Thioredoxin
MILCKRLSCFIVLLWRQRTHAKNGVFQPGVVQEGIVALTMQTFDNAIQDIANPLWLIEFHAPWYVRVTLSLAYSICFTNNVHRCGVCLRFRPTLALVANAARGKMAVGTVDCTVEDSLCKQRFRITGFPTLMYAHYGRVEDSPLQHDRSVDDFVDFARRMSMSSVSVVQTMEEAQRFAKEQGVDGVAFVAFHPKGSMSATETGSIGWLETFREAAQRLRRYCAFVVLQPWSNEGAQLVGEGPFICRLEDDVPVRCYDGISETIDLDGLVSWIERERIPTVSSLTATGLEELGNKGHQVCVAKVALREYATTGAPAIRERYYYGIIDASTYEVYLRQLGYDTSNPQPQIFLKNFLTKEYWQNATYGLDITSFLNDVEEGVVPSQSKRKNQQRPQSLATRLKNGFHNHWPWSYLLVIGPCIFFLTFLSQFIKVRKSLRPPYPRSVVAGMTKSTRPLVPNVATKKKQ